MKEIIINYIKDFNTPNDYLVKRVIRQYDNIYDVVSYYMINKNLRPFPSRVLFTEITIAQYIEDCKKSKFFKNIIEQEVLI